MRAILAEKPDAVVLIDYPGFNLRLAKALRRAQFPGKIIYYISPQVWAWHRGRIPKMAQILDLMLCIFPFEKALYEGCGLRTIFTGHPLVAYHGQQPNVPREENLLGFFPGSRRREVAKLFPIMLEASKILAERLPQVRLVASAASPKLEALMRELLAARPSPNVKISTGNAAELMRRCAAGLVASGTATLEAAILGLPYALVYKVAWPTYAVGKRLIRVDWLGIVNILAGREIVKEFVQHDATAENFAGELERLWRSPEIRAALREELKSVVEKLGGGDAYTNAAAAVTQCVGGGR